MENKQKIAVAIVVIIALAAAWQFGKNPKNQTPERNDQEVEQEEASENENSGQQFIGEKPVSSETAPGVWEGKLSTSDNAAKGNLKLTTTDHVIYIRTSRDYSALVGKNVKITYEGTLESFVLGDITEK